MNEPAYHEVLRPAIKCYEAEAEAAREARRKAFAKGQEEGLSLRDIADTVGLLHTRVLQILRGD